MAKHFAAVSQPWTGTEVPPGRGAASISFGAIALRNASLTMLREILTVWTVVAHRRRPKDHDLKALGRRRWGKDDGAMAQR